MMIMNIETRKLNIINWVSHLQDEAVLSRIEQLQSQKQDWWDLISEEEKAEIKEGISQADKGETKTTEEVLSKYRKWL
jgi:predicted transcriptional regulator